MDLTHSHALSLLFDDLEPELYAPNGAMLRNVNVLSASGSRAVILADLADALNVTVLEGQVTDDELYPWTVTLRALSSDPYNTRLARLELTVDRVAPASSTPPRRDDRGRPGGTAWLTAVSCAQIADGQRIEANVESLWPRGLEFTTSGALRGDDRLTFHGRFPSERVDVDIRVVDVDDADRGVSVSARFILPDPVTTATIARVLGGRAEPAHPAPVPPAPAYAEPPSLAPQAAEPPRPGTTGGFSVTGLRSTLDYDEYDDEDEPPRRRFRLFG